MCNLAESLLPPRGRAVSSPRQLRRKRRDLAQVRGREQVLGLGLGEPGGQAETGATAGLGAATDLARLDLRWPATDATEAMDGAIEKDLGKRKK